MAQKKEFKSYKPRRYYTPKQYASFDGNMEINANVTLQGHLFKEKCSNCHKPFGSHFGNDTAYCLPLKYQI